MFLHVVWKLQVTHSLGGLQILRNFVVGVVGAPTDWNMADIAEEFIREVRPWPHGSKFLYSSNLGSSNGRVHMKTMKNKLAYIGLMVVAIGSGGILF